MQYAHILTHLIDNPLYTDPVKAAVFYNAVCGRLGTPPVELSRFVGEWPTNEDGAGTGRRGRTEPFKLTPAGVGIITITGTMLNRGAWVGSFWGLTSYEGVKHQLQRAAGDSRVKSIILDLDSPGGEAAGAFEAAQAVRQAAEHKPVIAIANGMAASAGYALASGATKIITTPSGTSGSIGCVMLHLDYSRAMEAAGVRPTLIVAGAHKTDGNAVEPLDEGALATLRSEVDRYYELFVETVAAGRGRRTPASIARGTEGRAYVGRDAVDARLVDDVGTFEEVLGDLSRRAGRPASSSGTQARSQNMDPLLDEETENPVTEELPAPKPAAADPRIRLVEDSTIADGEALQLARFRAIAADARVKGKLEFAIKLACQAPDLTAEAIGALCEDIPSSGRLTLAERSRETGVEAVSSAPVPEPKSQTAKGWDEAITRTNARTLAEAPRRR